MKISFTLIAMLILCAFNSSISAQVYPDLKINLSAVNNQGSPELVDGNLVMYGAEYSSDIDFNDAPKMTNFGENIAIERNDKIFAIERRQKEFQNDTIFFRVWKMRQASYQFKIRGRYLSNEGRKGFLEDTYLKTKIEIGLDSTVLTNFSITSDPASADIHRFRIVIGVQKVEPVIFTEAVGDRKSNGVELRWDVADAKNIRQFQIEKLMLGNHFMLTKTIKPDNRSQEIFSWIDIDASLDFATYRISSVNIAGKVEYSEPISIAKIEKNYRTTIFPNPVKTGMITVTVHDLSSGNYTYRLVSNSGKLSQVGQVTIAHSGTINLAKDVFAGVYYLQISKNNKVIINQNILVQ